MNGSTFLYVGVWSGAGQCGGHARITGLERNENEQERTHTCNGFASWEANKGGVGTPGALGRMVGQAGELHPGEPVQGLPIAMAHHAVAFQNQPCLGPRFFQGLFRVPEHTINLSDFQFAMLCSI